MKTLETVLWILGVLLLTAYIGAHTWSAFEQERGLAMFAEAQQAHEIRRMSQEGVTEAPVAAPPGGAQQPAADAIIAVLRIPGIKLEVPVSYGTADNALRRGAGLIEGTALPGTQGNAAIAGHRDTFFRGLMEVALGDLIELDSLNRTITYRVTELFVVGPADVYVLADTGERVLTLITCFPLRFVGNAPQRFVVRAVPDNVSI